MNAQPEYDSEFIPRLTGAASQEPVEPKPAKVIPLHEAKPEQLSFELPLVTAAIEEHRIQHISLRDKARKNVAQINAWKSNKEFEITTDATLQIGGLETQLGELTAEKREAMKEFKDRKEEIEARLAEAEKQRDESLAKVTKAANDQLTAAGEIIARSEAWLGEG